MAGEANAAEFEGAAYTFNYHVARGLDPAKVARFIASGQKPDSEVTGGILIPEPEKLRPNTTIYRFGNTAKDLERDRTGWWWMTRETLELLARYAGDAESLVRIARQHLAVPPNFSTMNRCFTADLRVTLRAFGGVGGLVFQDPPASAAGLGRTVIWPGGAELTGTSADRTMKRQLFIPGLAKLPNALAHRPTQTVAEWLTGFRHGDG